MLLKHISICLKIDTVDFYLKTWDIPFKILEASELKISEPDIIGEKKKLWNLCISGSLIYLIITSFSFVPEYFNYLEEITEENAEKLYRQAINILRFLRIAVIFIYLTISLAVIYPHILNYGSYPLVHITVAVFPYILVIYSTYLLFKN